MSADDAPAAPNVAALLSATPAEDRSEHTATPLPTVDAVEATQAAWEKESDSTLNILDLCRSCGKPNATLHDLFANTEVDRDDGGENDDIGDLVGGEQTSSAENLARYAPADVENSATSAATDTAAAQLNASASKIDDIVTDGTTDTTAAEATTAAAAIAAATASASAKATAQGQSNMENILQEMQIWQLRIKPNDGLPQRICPKCTAQFYIIHKFRRKCLKVQIRLRALHEERCLEEEQQLLQHEKDTDTDTLDLNVPPSLDIGNDLINDNYGQPLSEAELFESAAWNATDAPLLDSDVSKTEVEPEPDMEVDVEVEVETEMETEVDVAMAMELDVGAVEDEQIDEETVLELEAPQSVPADELMAKAATIDEEALLATHVIFKSVDDVMVTVGASCEAPEKFMQSEKEPSLDKLEDECIETAEQEQLDADVLAEEGDYYEETLIERCDNELDDTTMEPTSELEQLDTLSNVDLLTTHENALKEEATESITPAIETLQTAEKEIQNKSTTTSTVQSNSMEVECETTTTNNVADEPNSTTDQVTIEGGDDALIKPTAELCLMVSHNEQNSSTRSADIREVTADCSEQSAPLSTDATSSAAPSDDRSASDDKSVAATSTAMKSTEPSESLIVTKAALKAYGSPTKSRAHYRVQRSLRRSLNWRMARLSSSTPNSSTLSPLTVSSSEVATQPVGELNAIATSSAVTQAASLSTNASSVAEALSAADASAQAQENVNPQLPEVSRAIFSSFSTAKRGRRLKWRARAVGAHKRKHVVSEHAAKSQIPTCFVRLRRLHMDRWVCETDVTEVSTAAMTCESRDISENESDNVRQDLSRKAETTADDNAESAVSGVSESAPLRNERSMKRFRKRKYASESKYTEMVARSSPWRTKAEMKEDMTGECKMSTGQSEPENAIVATEQPAADERLADAAESTLNIEQIKAVDGSETEPILKKAKRGRKPKLGAAKVTKIVTHRKRYRRKKEVQIVERRSKRIRKRLKGKGEMGDCRSADESICSDKSDILPNVFPSAVHAAAMKPASAEALEVTTIGKLENETPAAAPDNAEISSTHELLKEEPSKCAHAPIAITQSEIIQVKADRTQPISTQVQPMAQNVHFQSGISAPKENCDSAADSVAPTSSVSSTEELVPTTKSETEALPTALIVRISLASLSTDFQRMHLKQTRDEDPNSRSANLSPAIDAENQQESCSNVLEREHSIPKENKCCASAAADCSDAVAENSATVADNIATAEPAVAEPYIAGIANDPSHVLDSSSASVASPTDAADIALVTEFEHSQCSQQDSDQSEFLGFTQESDSKERLNASTTSSESQDSIEAQRAADPNTSMNASSKIHDFINEFQAHCIDPSEVEADEEEEQMYQQQQQAAMSALHMTADAMVSLNHQQQQSSMQLLSESNLSEMQDVETTLSGILNEMQDQHIYTPVTSHTDDFFTQSVYSPLSEPPSTPTHSIYVESPINGGGSGSGVGGGLSAESSPYVPHSAGVQIAKTSTVVQSAGEDAFTKNFPTYGECFTEDSTQSELIGFQNDIPCFENIEMAATAASTVATTPTTSAASSPSGRLTSGCALVTNSALQGALPKSATDTNVQYLGMAHDSEINDAAANGMGLVCTTGSGVQVHAPAFQVSPVATATVAQIRNGQGRGVGAAYVDDSEKEYAVDSATLQLAQLLNDLQPPHQQQHQQQQEQPLIHPNDETTSLAVTGGSTLSAPTKSVPVQHTTHGVHKVPRNSSSNAKVQYVTLAAGSSVSESQHMQLADINSLQMGGISHTRLYNSTSVGPQEIQWTTSTGETVTATTTNVLDGQATAATTTYYINASDLYQSNLITTTSTQAAMVTAPTLDTVTVSALSHVPQQPMELDKCSMDANENYIEGLQQQRQQQQQQQQQQEQQQPIMIVIPHEFMRADASSGTAAAGTTQIYTTNTSTANDNVSQDLSHTLHIAQTPQTVLVQQPTQLALSARSGANFNVNNNSASLNMNRQYLTTSTVVASPSLHTSHTPSPQHRQPQQKLHLATVTPPPVQRHPRHTSTPPQAPQQQQKQQAGTQPQEKVNLTCRFCHKRPKFTSNLDYSNHIIAMHPVETPFNCPLCPMHFTRRVKRQQHIVEEHGAHRFQCAQCGQSFSTQRALDLHLQRSHAPESSKQQQQQKKQQQSQALLHAQQRYLAHRSAWAEGGSGAVANHAQTQLVRVEDVHLHVSDEDNKDKKSIDLQLGSGTLTIEPSPSSQTSKQQRILCCPDCDDPFDETHAHSHPQQQPEQQQQQQKSLHVTLPSPEQTEPDSTSTTTLRHFRKRRASNAKLAANVTAAAANCSSSSAKAAALAADGAAPAEDELLLMERVMRTSHNCLFCDERFTNEISLRKHHLLAHSSQTTMPFVCSICKRGFRMRTALQRHMETHDSEGRPFECTLCHVRFPRPSQLTLHKLTVHFLKKPHTCEECGKQFGTESALKTHAKFHGERDVECDMCSRKFFLMKDMRKHRRVHTGERFYKCDLCPSSFLHYTRLSAHLKTHQPLGAYLPQDSPLQPQMQQQQCTAAATALISAESAQQVQQQQQQPELTLASASEVISTTATGSVISTP